MDLGTACQQAVTQSDSSDLQQFANTVAGILNQDSLLNGNLPQGATMSYTILAIKIGGDAPEASWTDDGTAMGTWVGTVQGEKVFVFGTAVFSDPTLG